MEVLSLNKKEYVAFKAVNGVVKYIIDTDTSKKNVSFKYNIDNKSIYTKDFIDTVAYKYQYLDTTHKYMTHLITLNNGIAYLTDFDDMTITPYTSVSDLKKDLLSMLYFNDTFFFDVSLSMMYFTTSLIALNTTYSFLFNDKTSI